MRTKLLILVLFATLTLVYFRFVALSPTDALLTKHLATDLYGHFVHVWERLNMLREGFVPVGDYWVLRGGGYPAASNDQILIPQEFLLMVLYAVTNSFTASLKALVPLFYFATLVTAYWYGTVLLRRRDASIVLAVAYTFSMYGVNQLEHLELIGVQPLILLALVFLEKLLASPEKPKYVVLTSLFLFLVFLSNLYALSFTLIFIGFRLVFHLLTQPRRLEALRSVSKAGVLFVLAAFPFLLPQLLNMPAQELKDTLTQDLLFHSQPPSLFFLRGAPFEPYLTEIYFMYFGLSVLLLALVPMLMHKPLLNKLYLFHLLVAMFLFLYAIGQYGPINLALWVSKLIFFIRVPGRALVIGYLCFSVCAAIGFAALADKLRTSRWKTALMLLAVVVIFADLTIGFEPRTMTVPPIPESTYQFLETQPGNFRVVEISSVHDQQAMTIIRTGHDTLNSILWGFGFFEPLRAFTALYVDYVDLEATAQTASLYGVRYVVVNADPKHSETFRDALTAIRGPALWQVRRVDKWLSESSNYELVYEEEYINVYENMTHRGLVFSRGADFLAWSRRDPNTLVIDYDSTMPTTIIVSQSYDEGWVATINDRELPIHNFLSVQMIVVPVGNHQIILHYRNYERWFGVLALFYAFLAGAVVWVVRGKHA